MNFVPATSEFGILIRKDALAARGISRDDVLAVFERQAPMGENDALLSFGPHFGEEAGMGLVRALERLGLVYVEEFFMLSTETPDWCLLGAALSVPVTVHGRTAPGMFVDTATLHRLAAHASPSAIPDTSSNGTREHRFWVVRLRSELSNDGVSDLAAAVQAGTTRAVRLGRVERGLPAEAEHGEVAVEVHRVGPLHVLLRVTTIVHRLDNADSSLLAQAAALRTLDGAAPIDDIQGFPKDCWSILLA